MNTSLRLLAAFALSFALGCEDTGASGGEQGEVCTTAGFLCATPACSQFTTNPGCDFVKPTLQHCPADHFHCFDPSLASNYCGPEMGVCGKALNGRPCGAKLCTAADVMVCYQTNSDVLCTGGYQCVTFAADCPHDGGMPVDQATPPGDGGTPDAAITD